MTLDAGNSIDMAGNDEKAVQCEQRREGCKSHKLQKHDAIDWIAEMRPGAFFEIVPRLLYGCMMDGVESLRY